MGQEMLEVTVGVWIVLVGVRKFRTVQTLKYDHQYEGYVSLHMSGHLVCHLSRVIRDVRISEQQSGCDCHNSDRHSQ